MQCPKCGVADAIEIKQKLPDDTEVQFFACHKCDAKWWDKDGEPIQLRDVLDLARKSRS